jgi:hypothetical protein
MSHTEIYQRRPNQFRLSLLLVGAVIALYLYFGFLSFIFWVIGAIAVVNLLVVAIRGENKGDPLIILNEEGVFDKSLKVGVIRWEDIRRIKSHKLHGQKYISLELDNLATYESRRPIWLRWPGKVFYLLGMTPITIMTRHLDMKHDTLIDKLHEGCGGVTKTSRTLNWG